MTGGLHQPLTRVVHPAGLRKSGCTKPVELGSAVLKRSLLPKVFQVGGVQNLTINGERSVTISHLGVEYEQLCTVVAEATGATQLQQREYSAGSVRQKSAVRPDQGSPDQPAAMRKSAKVDETRRRLRAAAGGLAPRCRCPQPEMT
jgi:hypothetical protein